MTAGHGDHTDLWDYIDDLRERLGHAENRIAVLEKQTPSALQAQRELDETLAGNAAADYDRHGRNCQCPYCAVDEG